MRKCLVASRQYGEWLGECFAEDTEYSMMECVPREQGVTGHDEELLGVDLLKGPIWVLVNGDLGGWPPHDYRDRDEAIPVRSGALECEPDVLLGRSFVCGSGSIWTLIGLQRQSGTRRHEH